MVDRANTEIREKGHEPDKSDANRSAEFHARICACEDKLGIKREPGVAKEETGVRTRKRH